MSLLASFGVLLDKMCRCYNRYDNPVGKALTRSMKARTTYTFLEHIFMVSALLRRRLSVYCAAQSDSNFVFYLD